MTVTANHPILYDPLENPIAVLNLAYNVKVTQRLQQEWTIEFDHPLDSAGKWAEITTEGLVSVEGEKYVLKVVETDDTTGVILKCQGEHVSTQTIDEFIDPADDATLGRNSYPLGVTAQTALQNALLGSRFTLGTVSVPGVLTTSTADAPQGAVTITVTSVAGLAPGNVIQIGSAEAVISAGGITGTTITLTPALFVDQPSGTPVGININDINMQERNLTDVLREIETTWNGELVWSNRTVSFVPQMGQANGVVFRYRKNNKNIKRTQDSRTFATRLYGYGSGGLTIESIHPTKYLDAANIGSYPYPIKLKKDYSQIADPESLLQAMQTDLATLSTPVVTYQLSVVELARVASYPYPTLETFGLGDTVTVIDERLNDMSIVSRINEAERYPYEPQLSQLQIQSLIQTTYNQMADVHSGVTSLLQTANITPQRNGRPIGTPANPTGASISVTNTNTDGSVNVNVAWAFTEDPTSPIDGYGILMHLDVNNTAYTFPATVTADSSHVVDKTVRGYTIQGVPANLYYTVAVYALRSVDSDINTAGLIKGGRWYANAGAGYQPSTSVNFTGSVYGVPGNQISKTPATLIIADGSTSHNANRADYVVPVGATNADVTINQAIAALPATGGKIVLLDGTFQTSGEITPPSNVTIAGQGGSTIIKGSSAIIGGVINAYNQANVVVADLVVNANGALDGVSFGGASGGAIINTTVFGAADGIFLSNSDGLTIYGCTVYNCTTGIYASNVSNSKIFTNTTYNNSQIGIQAVVVAGTSNNLSITGNTCYGNTQYGINVSGDIGTTYISSVTVAGNTCFSNQYGITLYYAESCAVSGNTSNGNVGVGIFLFECLNSSVSGNTCQGNGTYGIYFWSSSSNNTITGNTAIGNGTSASLTYDNIYLASNCNYNNIQSNVVRKGTAANLPRYGINISDSTCTGNMITNNDLYTAGATANLNDAGTGTVTVSGNRVA